MGRAVHFKAYHTGNQLEFDLDATVQYIGSCIQYTKPTATCPCHGASTEGKWSSQVICPTSEEDD